jgi:hypothetical protein
MAYKYMGIWIKHWIYWTLIQLTALMNKICSGALTKSHSYSLQFTIARTESSWSAVQH